MLRMPSKLGVTASRAQRLAAALWRSEFATALACSTNSSLRPQGGGRFVSATSIVRLRGIIALHQCVRSNPHYCSLTEQPATGLPWCETRLGLLGTPSLAVFAGLSLCCSKGTVA